MRIVISSCLLGHKTRYDGQSKPVALPPQFADAELIPFCPEVAAGFGVPREPIELTEEGGGGKVRVVRVRDRVDVTARLVAACEKEIARLKAEVGQIDLFVLKSRSPSCGLEAPLRDEGGVETGKAAGVWAALVRAHFPQARIVSESEF